MPFLRIGRKKMTKMEGYSCVRCLFCNTGKEEAVVQAVHKNSWGRAIFPRRIRTIRQGRKWLEAPIPLLPGYVFVYSGQVVARHDELSELQHVIRVLSYGTGEQDGLVGRDLEFADWLWQLDGRIGIMKALQMGDRIEIIDGVFKQLRGTIVQMDRRRRTICVELGTEGAVKRIWLAYDIVEKLDAKE